MKTLSTICILAGLLLASSANAQPARGWFYFDMNAYAGFYDLYACENGDLVACGYNVQDCIARVTSHGDEIWTQTIDNGRGGYTLTLIETDNNDLVVGGNFGQHFTVFRFTADGELIWRHDYGSGACLSIIELKNGNLALAGYSPNAVSNARLIIVNGAGDPVRDREYDVLGRPQFNCMREVEDGIVLLGNYRGNTQYPFLMKVDENGDQEWIFDYGQQYISANSFNGLVSLPGGGFGILVMPFQVNGAWAPALLRVDSRGEIIWAVEFRDVNIYMMPSLAYIPDIGFIIGGGTRGNSAFAICVTADGDEAWRAIYDGNMGEECDPTNIRAIVLGTDRYIYAAGDAQPHDGNQAVRGMIFRLGWGSLDPELFYYEPLDTVFTLLRGDEQGFKVVANNPFGGEVFYQWLVNEEVQEGNDTTFSYVFDEAGEFVVRCRVVANQREANVRWHITVSDLFISAFHPDSVRLNVCRNARIDFSIEISASPGDPVQFEWLLDNQQVGQDDSVSLDFNIGRERLVQATAFRGDQMDSQIWRIIIVSPIGLYYPEMLDFTAKVDSLLLFWVDPFFPESDSLSYLWLKDGDTIGYEQAVEIQFASPGAHSVKAWLQDGSEIDSVEWVVNVIPVEDGVNEGQMLQPAFLSLSAYPNPFNSSTTISYTLPDAGWATMDVIDMNGRIVAGISEGWKEAGSYRNVFDGKGIPSGILILRLRSGAETHRRFIHLIR